jgi:adenine-specific DNA methylase
MPKRLIEVDLPIKKVSEQARREKSIRHGHISTLHIWWARRPLAACRAVILAGLLPDPADDACPQPFRHAALKALAPLPGKMRPADDRLGLRQAILDFIADFSDWDRSADPTYLKAARALVAAAHPDGPPTVLDPFAGGGAIPLEALRVGADAWASDLNPVAVLLEKVVLEYIPRYGEKLAEGVRQWGTWIKEQAQAELGHFYPSHPDGSTPIAYIWARTGICEGPDCGARVPLMRGMWLSKKAGRHVSLKLLVKGKDVEFAIETRTPAGEVGPGTVKRGSLTCPVCGHTTPVASIREQARTRGLPERLVAVVTTTPGAQGRRYRLPDDRDLIAAAAAKDELERRKAAHHGRLSLVPDELLPPQGTLGFRVQAYGFKTWGDLFTPRQALALTTLARLVRESRGPITAEARDAGLADAIVTCLALAVDRQVDSSSTGCRWLTTIEALATTFGRQALPMVWDFAEGNPLSESGGNWDGAVDWIEKVARRWGFLDSRVAQVACVSATSLPLPDASISVVSTDPPYYDAVAYADLSDFFYVWLRRSVADVHPDLLAAELSPKKDEIVVNPTATVDGRKKLGAFFEEKMAQAFREARRVLTDSGIAIVVFAHKSTSGWEAMLQALVNAGWTVTGSWPLDTERGVRLRAMNSAALTSSVHLVCRPRLVDAGVGDWGSILRELQPRVDEWMRRLSRDGVVGADAIFACLGPAIELYSKYERVETASGQPVSLGGRAATGDDYLSQVWAAVSRSALRTIFDEAEATGFEPDGRLAAVWLWTVAAPIAAHNGATKPEEDELEEAEDEEPASTSKVSYVLPYDTARKLAQPLGADLQVLTRENGAAFEVKGSSARLLPVAERRKYLLDTDGEAPLPVPNRRGQVELFAESVPAGPAGAVRPAGTTLDRVNQAMLLFADERGEALRRLLVDDGVGQDGRFWRLADALSKLYPPSSPEKRWVDGVLARKKMLRL